MRCIASLQADFYMIQINANTIEARFRNASGINFDLVYAGLQLNTWQHFVFTYDGSLIKLFHNGVEVSSISANGAITNTVETFYVGNGLYQGTEFTFDGKADEIVLFDRAVTPQEINCFYHGSVDTLLSGLKLYYSCNQGNADGNNAGLTLLNGIGGQPAGTLTNFALSGTSSNWVNGMNFIGVANATVCNGDSLSLGGQYFTLPGVYAVTVPGSSGCDSTVMLNLAVFQVDTSVIRINTQLTTTGVADVYQWVDCNNNFAAIPGANQANYNVTVDGNYAVIILDGGCVDTSRCIMMSVEGIHENGVYGGLQLSPVLAKDVLNISGVDLRAQSISVSDATGRKVWEKNILTNSGRYEMETLDLPNGFYFLFVLSEEGLVKSARFVVNR